MTQKDCDDNFRKCMENKCAKYKNYPKSSSYWERNSERADEYYDGQSEHECLQYAAYYAAAVCRLGRGAWENAQKKCSNP